MFGPKVKIFLELFPNTLFCCHNTYILVFEAKSWSVRYCSKMFLLKLLTFTIVLKKFYKNAFEIIITLAEEEKNLQILHTRFSIVQTSQWTIGNWQLSSPA